MKSKNFNIVRYDADDGKVFDWVEPCYQDVLDENGNITGKFREHLYAKTLFIGDNDSINNYIEVDAPEE